MKSFITVTFLFLGGAYYALSDGPNFVPESQSPMEVAAADISDVEVTRAAGDDVVLASMTNAGSLNLPVIAEPASAEPEIALEPEAEVIEVAAAPAADEMDIWEVAGSRVNMRAGPGTDYLVLDTLNGGTDLELLETRAGWARVRLVDGEVEGWMAERLLEPES
ncbi:SH3 domain-containing protein [Pseudoroseicyclus tamaricis]|uniref:SH3 domain-containing protein n=1 Tax=Pseudoroseicyclus tamaricis TaxID=2705421 RepID=A0A6B2K5R9_9RHOB|nr:SH3 domain-containing protein [Pseudoroseicyclus tamaricis]NDV02146.1 SH3 domain-containing protein [Pseudoroseicyclus tamaricis]